MKKYLLLLVGLSMLAGCSGTPLKFSTPINKVEGKDYQVLGYGEGSSTGIMLFQVIPIGQNDRFQDAYNKAVASKGGTRIIEPVIQEDWFWAYVLNGYSTKVSGIVVKDFTDSLAGPNNAVINTNPKNTVDKIRELKKLFDDGLITKEEYEIKKAKYVNEL